jgi:TolA-binding protein
VRRLFNVTQEHMMNKVSKLVFSLCLALGIAAPAAAQMQSSDPMPMHDSDRVYGYELMTPQERNEYQTRMRALNTEQEREAFRLEHHEKMQERAKAQGKTLPDTPPADRGPGMGPGGGGMGPGYGR